MVNYWNLARGSAVGTAPVQLFDLYEANPGDGGGRIFFTRRVCVEMFSNNVLTGEDVSQNMLNAAYFKIIPGWVGDVLKIFSKGTFSDQGGGRYRIRGLELLPGI